MEHSYTANQRLTVFPDGERLPDGYIVEWLDLGAAQSAAYVNKNSALAKAAEVGGSCKPLYKDDVRAGYAEAVSLAKALHRAHYHTLTNWHPLDTTAGVVSQIDNMTAGLMSADEITEAVKPASAIRSGPYDDGGIAITVVFPRPGSETALYYLLVNAATKDIANRGAA